MANLSINYDDTSIDLIQNVPSGSTYLARFASAEDLDTGRTTSVITALYGPVDASDFDGANWIDLAVITLAQNSTDEDVEWANGETWRSIKSSV